MKTKLPDNSINHEERIKNITDIILSSEKDKIAFIILFGSFAKGTWIFERYSEDRTLYEYASDYDFLIITKSKRSDNENGISSFDLERKIKNKLYKTDIIRHDHNPHFIIEPLDLVNAELEKGRYFFSDIKKEGVVLYDSGEFTLSEPKQLNEKESKEIAKKDYEHWFQRALNFLKGSHFYLEEEAFNEAAFSLHQTTESLYNCCLLTLTGYKPKSHNLEDLNRLCAAQTNDFLKIFPIATEEQKKCFELLQKAYIEARYSKNYKISIDQLRYLLERVILLKELVDKICKQKI